MSAHWGLGPYAGRGRPRDSPLAGGPPGRSGWAGVPVREAGARRAPAPGGLPVQVRHGGPGGPRGELRGAEPVREGGPPPWAEGGDRGARGGTPPGGMAREGPDLVRQGGRGGNRGFFCFRLTINAAINTDKLTPFVCTRGPREGRNGRMAGEAGRSMEGRGARGVYQHSAIGYLTSVSALS